MPPEIKIFHCLPVPYPAREVGCRLGTGVEPRTTGATERRAFACCRPQGRYALLRITGYRADETTLEDGTVIRSADFFPLCDGAAMLWCAAVTAGGEITARRDGGGLSVAEKMICDAVGSETADAAMDFLHRSAAAAMRSAGMQISPRRFSPGYGDMPLDLQRWFYRILKMDEMGITLTANNFMLPEKTVTAFAPVRISGGEERI